MHKNTRSTGSCYERKAADYLKQQGLFILRYNYRCRFGEIDLIARDGEYLVFVEVKYRKDNSSGYSLAALIIIETALMNNLPYSRKGIMKYEDKMEQ